MNDNRQMMTERASSEPGERTGSRRRPARSIGLIVLTVTATALVLTQLAYDNLRTRGWTTYVSANDIGLGSHDLIPGFDLQALAVDSLNRVWVGSNEGLNMLSPNGEWANYTTTNSGLAESTIQTLAIDEKGQVWVGTTWGGAECACFK